MHFLAVTLILCDTFGSVYSSSCNIYKLCVKALAETPPLGHNDPLMIAVRATRAKCTDELLALPVRIALPCLPREITDGYIRYSAYTSDAW